MLQNASYCILRSPKQGDHPGQKAGHLLWRRPLQRGQGRCIGLWSRFICAVGPPFERGERELDTHALFITCTCISRQYQYQYQSPTIYIYTYIYRLYLFTVFICLFISLLDEIGDSSEGCSDTAIQPLLAGRGRLLNHVSRPAL